MSGIAAGKRARRKARIEKRRRRIEWRLREREWANQQKPMLRGSNIHYEISDRTQAVSAGGIGAVLNLVGKLGLVEEIDQRLHLLKAHKPYHESDHVLTIAFNALCGGTCLDDIELRRNDEAFLNCLGAQRIPDPTTAGDFCRRFTPEAIETLQDAINTVRLRVWKMQPKSFFDEAIIDVDGTIAPTTGECKEGMGISYNGVWGYHPLIVSLANTGEPLFLMNRGGNRPSEEGAAGYIDKAIELCRRAGFRKITVRGDTAFSQTQHLDRWHEAGVRFLFGFDARSNLVEKAGQVPQSSWAYLIRNAKYEVQTEPRTCPENVKERIVVENKYQNIRLLSEEVAEFQYQPVKCQRAFRMIALQKNLSVEKGEHVMFPDLKYFFYITNFPKMSAAALVLMANGRCNQENLIAQLKSGVRALRMPVSDLVSNWAYMIMASLAWTLKAWFALILPETGRWAEQYQQEKQAVLRMEFRTFLNLFILVPAQIIRTGRRIIFRLLAWNPFQHVFVRALEVIERPALC